MEEVSPVNEFVIWGITDMGKAEALYKVWLVGRGRGS